MKCKKCDHLIQKNDKFCGKCGEVTNLNKEEIAEKGEKIEGIEKAENINTENTNVANSPESINLENTIPEQPFEESNSKKPMNVKKLVIIAVVALVIVGGITGGLF